MAAISKRISLTTSECDATSQPAEVGSHATHKTIYKNDFLKLPLDILLKDWNCAIDKMSHGT